MLRRGYAQLKKGRGKYRLLDPSPLFDGVKDAYFDPNHFTKVGNALLGKFIREAVLSVAP